MEAELRRFLIRDQVPIGAIVPGAKPGEFFINREFRLDLQTSSEVHLLLYLMMMMTTRYFVGLKDLEMPKPQNWALQEALKYVNPL